MRGVCLAFVLALAPSCGVQAEGLTGHGGPVMDVRVAGDGQIATASFDNAVGLWREGLPVWLDGHDAAVNAVIFLGDGKLASGGDDFAVILWSEAGDATRLEGHRGKVAALALSPDGRTLASASWDGRIGLWPVAGGEGRFLDGHGAAVNDVAFGPDGALYSAGADGTIRVWDVARGEDMRVVARHGFGVNRLAMGPNWLAYGAVDGGTRLIAPATGELLADFTAERRPILALAHAPETGYLAVGDGEGFIMVVDTESRQVVHDFRAMAQGPVWALAFAPGGDRLYAGGLDETVSAFALDATEGAVPAAASSRSYLADPATMDNGERQFQRKCSICHALGPDTARKAGPTLHRLIGRPAGRVAGYTYSDRLDGSRIVWSAATIDALFEQGPEHYVPGSKMPMQRIADPQDRADLIAFLARTTAPEGGTR